MTLLVSAFLALVCILPLVLAASAQWRSIDRAIARLAEWPPDKYMDFHRETPDREAATEGCGWVSAVYSVNDRSARRLRGERYASRRSGKWARESAVARKPCAGCELGSRSRPGAGI